MPDWVEFVRQRLSGLALDDTEKDEVHAEVAGHLRESYESLRAQGVPEQVALSKTLAQVTDWSELQQQIQMTRQRENMMTPRTGRLWFPSLVTLLVTMTLPPLLERFGLNPQFLLLRERHGQTYVFTAYTVWLLLPFVGALGAYRLRSFPGFGVARRSACGCAVYGIPRTRS